MLVQFFHEFWIKASFSISIHIRFVGRGVFLYIFLLGFPLALMKNTVLNFLWKAQTIDHCKSTLCGGTQWQKQPIKQCSGSVTLWYRSGCVDLYHWVTNSDPALFFKGFQNDNKIIFFIAFTSVFKDNNLFRRQKLWKTKFFFFFVGARAGSL